MLLDKSVQPTQIAHMANGKGDLRRPSVIPEHELSARWFQAFGNTRCPMNPAVARSEIAAAEGRLDAAPCHGVDLASGPDQTVEVMRDGNEIVWMSIDGLCTICGESSKLSTKCHGGTNTKNPGPRRK